MKRAALYCRVSTLDQHPETQLHDLRQFAAQRGLQIVQEYIDHGICGAKARRPALDKMMDDARRHKFDVLMVWACDRLGRSTRHLLATLDELNGFGIQLTDQFCKYSCGKPHARPVHYGRWALPRARWVRGAKELR
jgi:DNA invertase Pin-like site-specific DNA recombinase